MKIDSKILSEFVKKTAISLAGDSYGINECVFDFQENGLNVEAITESNTVFVAAFLEKKAFISYEPIGKVGIGSTVKLRKIIDRFENDITFKKQENLLIFSNNGRQFDFVLPHIEAIVAAPKQPNLEYMTTFKVDSKFFIDALKNADILEKGLSIKLSGKDRQLTAECGEDDKARETVSIPEIREEIKVKFGEPFREVIGVLDGTVTVSLKSNYPAKILVKTEMMAHTFIIAPMVDNE